MRTSSLISLAAAGCLILTLPVLAQERSRPSEARPQATPTEQAQPRPASQPPEARMQGHQGPMMGRGMGMGPQMQQRQGPPEGRGQARMRPQGPRPPMPPMVNHRPGSKGTTVILPGFYGWYSWQGRVDNYPPAGTRPQDCLRCHRPCAYAYR